MKTDTLTLAAVQLTALLTTPEQGLERHLGFIRQAREASVDLLLFPELSLTSYCIGTRVPELALRADDPIIQQIADAAEDITVCFGFVEEGPGTLFYNTAITVRDGQILDKHRKVNLPSYGRLEEGKHFAHGEEVNAFDPHPSQKKWRAGTLICAEHWSPLLLTLAALRGSNLVLAPIASALEAVGDDFSNPVGWELNLSNNALTFGSYIVMANWFGPQDDIHFWGGSRILNPSGATIVEAENRECMITAEADYDTIKQARYRLPTLRDIDPYHFMRELHRQTPVSNR